MSQSPVKMFDIPRDISLCNSYCYAGVSLICCGQLSLLVWIDSKPVTRRELLDNRLTMPVNGDPLKNLPIHTTHKSMNEKANPQIVESTRTDSTDTKISSTTTATPTAAADPVTVEEIKSLYDSELVLGHGVKLKWIRNRMMA